MTQVVIPPRSPQTAAVEMMLAFDVDCGELVPGHRFVARGLEATTITHQVEMAEWMRENPLPKRSEASGHRGSYIAPRRGFRADDTSFEARHWRWTHALHEALQRAEQVPGFHLHYELVPGLSAEEIDGGDLTPFVVKIEYAADVELPWPMTDQGSVAEPDGSGATAATRGHWPLPHGARLLTFRITSKDSRTGRTRSSPDGELVVDLTTQTATWLTITERGRTAD